MKAIIKKTYTPDVKAKPAIKITNLKSAKRLLGRLIYDLQRGTVSSQLAKDLTYLLNVYVNIFKVYENELRLLELEQVVKKDGGYGS